MSSKQLVIFLLLTCSIVIPLACADITSPRYMAAYFDYTPTATEKVLFGTDFQDTDYTYFDDDEFLAGVMSITGGSGTTPDSYIYQNGFALWDNNTVMWAPQTYLKM